LGISLSALQKHLTKLRMGTKRPPINPKTELLRVRIAELAAKGLTEAAIAKAIHRKPNTVRSHIKAMAEAALAAQGGQ
jgi:DNA-binding NarL/FixJ family response regulator